MPKESVLFQELIVTAVSDQIDACFKFDPKKYLISGVCNTPYCDNVTKITGTVRDTSGNPVNFIATVKFRVEKTESGLDAIVSNINVCDITLVGKYADPPTSCGDFKLYYNATDPDCCYSSEIIDNDKELIVYQVIEAAFSNANVSFTPDLLTVCLPFQTVTEPHLSYVVGGVLTGTNDPCNKNFNKYSITGCCPCSPPRPPCDLICKIIKILLKILIIVIILTILDPCCKYFLPPWWCQIKQAFLQRLTLK